MSTWSGRDAWERLFPPDQPNPLAELPPDAVQDAHTAADTIAAAHSRYLGSFAALTAQARETFEHRAWLQGAVNAEQRVRLYKTAVESSWRALSRQLGNRILDRTFWMAARRVFLERVFSSYDADLALTLFYSVMRLTLDKSDVPVEYADDGLASRPGIRGTRPLWDSWSGAPERLAASVAEALEGCGFRCPLEDARRDAALSAERILEAWRIERGEASPRELQFLRPLFFRDEEAYLVGRLTSPAGDLPVVLALRNEAAGITVDAVLTGTEDMRNILFVSTRSTFHVATDEYRELLAFLDALAPERGHPALCAVIGFTHPARVALNQNLRKHLDVSGERFEAVPGRSGTAMIVFAPPSYPYVFKVIRDHSSKQGWTGSQRIMSLYRWVHEINRGRLMLDAWLYRNLHFRRELFDERVLEELTRNAPGSVHMDGGTVILKTVYAQRRVRPLNVFFDEEGDPALRQRGADGLGAFLKDLAAMGLFMGDYYGLPFNIGLTHGYNAVLFDFDDLAPVTQYDFRETPPLSEKDELLWNAEVDGAWFQVGEWDVLVDEWERWLGVPEDLRDFFRQRHGDLFTLDYWKHLQNRLKTGELHHVAPYPPERRLVKERPADPWLGVPLQDYEAHMRAERVRQLDALSELFGRALEIARPAAVAVLGVAGGNGLERIDPAVTTRVAGVDINPDYLREVGRRFPGVSGLELRCVDLARETAAIAPVDLVHAALIFEHAGLGRCLDNALDLVAPGGRLSVVLQLPSDTEAGVSVTGVASIRALEGRFSLIEPSRVQEMLRERGFGLTHEERRQVASGKGLWMGVFRGAEEGK